MNAAALPTVGLCVDCRHAEVVASARSRFLRCARSDSDPAFARYPHLPVLVCRGYEGGGGAGGGEGARIRGR